MSDGGEPTVRELSARSEAQHAELLRRLSQIDGRLDEMVTQAQWRERIETEREIGRTQDAKIQAVADEVVKAHKAALETRKFANRVLLAVVGTIAVTLAVGLWQLSLVA